MAAFSRALPEIQGKHHSIAGAAAGYRSVTLGCTSVRKQHFQNSGFRDDADPRHFSPSCSTLATLMVRAQSRPKLSRACVSNNAALDCEPQRASFLALSWPKLRLHLFYARRGQSSTLFLLAKRTGSVRRVQTSTVPPELLRYCCAVPRRVPCSRGLRSLPNKHLK
jgi:hypothetical protein